MIGRLWTVTLLACQLISAPEFPTVAVFIRCLMGKRKKKTLRVAFEQMVIKTIGVEFMCMAQTLSGGFIVQHRLILLNSLCLLASDMDIRV